MGMHFDYRDYDFDEICDSLRERIAESKKPIPPKVTRHGISIVLRTSPNCCQYSHSLSNYRYDEWRNIETREDMEKYIENHAWIKKVDDNFWIEIDETRTYTDNDGKEVLYHYEIREYDYEEYEDGESHVEYSEDEKRYLSESLYAIEKARAYIRAYDYCSDQYSFGEGSFAKEVEEELDKFNKEFTEELPEDYNSDDY